MTKLKQKINSKLSIYTYMAYFYCSGTLCLICRTTWDF